MESGAAVAETGVRFKYQAASAPMPTVALIAAPTATEPDCPSSFIISAAARKQAAADPSVLTKYSNPSDPPTLRDLRTEYATSIGSVEPISIVGISSSAKLMAVVPNNEMPAVYRPT